MIRKLKLVVTVLDGDLSTDARLSNVYFGWSTEAHRRSRTKVEAGFGKGSMTCYQSS